MRQTKYCRVPIKQRLFSFNFTFQLSHYSILSFSPPTIKWAWLCESYQPEIVFFPFWIWWQPSLFHRRIVNPRLFTFILGKRYLENDLTEVIYVHLLAPSLPVTSFFQAEVIYVRFLLQCKTRLFTFISLKSREPKRLMVFPERKIVLYLTLCNSYFATSALFPLIPHRALLESFL